MNFNDEHDTRKLTRRDLLRRSRTAAVAAGVVASGLAPSMSPATAQTKGGRLRVGHIGGGSTERVFPYKNPSYLAIARNNNVWDPLVREGVPFSKIEYRLAESIEPTATNDVWQVKLRSGVTFHNGKSLTADDVLYTWEYILNPDNGATARKHLEGLIDLKNTKKVGELEIALALLRPVANLPAFLAGGWYHSGIVPDGTTDFEGPVGTGAFKISSFTVGQTTLLAKNPDYFDGEVLLDEVEMISIPDTTARLNALIAGEIDAIEFVDFPQAKANADNPAIKLMRTQADQTVPFTMRCDTKPFDDNRVRLAFKLAVDREKMVELALLGFGRVGNDLYGPSYPSYNHNLPQRTYDPEQAKSLLKEAGYDGLEVTLYTSTAVTGMLESATAFVEQAKPAGIKVNLTKLPADGYWNTEAYYLNAPFYQTNYFTPFELVARSSLLPGSSWTETKWDTVNPSWGERFLEAEKALDPAEQKAKYDALQEELWEQGGYIIWGFQDLIDAVSPKVQGLAPYPPLPLGAYQFQKAWLA